MSDKIKPIEQISAENQIMIRVRKVSHDLLPFVDGSGFVNEAEWEKVLRQALGVAFWEGAEYQRILMDHVREVLMERLKGKKVDC